MPSRAASRRESQGISSTVSTKWRYASMAHHVPAMESTNLRASGFSDSSVAAPARSSAGRRITNPISWARNATRSIRSKFINKSTDVSASRSNRFQVMAKNKRDLSFNALPTRVQHKSKKPIYGLLGAFLSLFIARLPAFASGGMPKRNPDAPVVPLSTNELASKMTIWLGIFTILALLHAAEIAITTLYPWKVREFAEEEEKASGGGSSGKGGRQRRGTFQALNEDITRVLTTILVTSTACSIYATTLFTHLADHVFGTYAEKWSAVFLTAVTLFFVELLPKNIGVINAEKVARLMVPPIMIVSNIVGPVGFALTSLAKATLAVFGIKAKEVSLTASEMH